MKPFGFTLKAMAFLALTLVFTSAAHAQQRTFVSSTGSDANACTRTSPCRSFQRAHDVVVAGGEVVALDSAGYGPFTITKSVTGSGEGSRAAITTTAAGNAVTINNAAAIVVLRDLNITGLNQTGTSGVAITAATSVHLERLAIDSFSANGIFLNTGGFISLSVIDTVSRNNGDGLEVILTGGTAEISIERSQFINNSLDGMDLCFGTIRAAISNSVASNNGQDGIDAIQTGAFNSDINISNTVAANNNSDGVKASAPAGNTATVTIEHSVFYRNLSGVIARDNGVVNITNSGASNNTTGFAQSGTGIFRSLGNNLVQNNTANTSGTITVVAGT